MRNGKVALVTGSSTGIGAGVALALAREGYHVAVHYNNSKEAAQKVISRIYTETDVRTCLLQGNTEDPETPARLVRETVEKLGRLDVMVNNAGVTIFQETRELTVDAMDKMYRLNFRGMILGASEAAKYMVENGVQGSIIFNTSIRGFAPHSCDLVYGGLKAGLNRVIRSMAIDLGRYGIRVNGFSPGVTNVMSPDPEDEKENPFYNVSHKFIPLRRNGYASDMGDAVCFLASDKASYITGQVLCVDGGLSVVGAPEHVDDLFNAFDVWDLVQGEVPDRAQWHAQLDAAMERQRQRHAQKQG